MPTDEDVMTLYVDKKTFDEMRACNAPLIKVRTRSSSDKLVFARTHDDAIPSRSKAYRWPMKRWNGLPTA